MWTRNDMSLLKLLVICFLILYGCATFHPRPEAVSFRERAETKYENNVQVTAAVLSEEESEAVFGVSLYNKGIQPVWLSIENNDEAPLWFLPVGLDPDYFAPLEVAYMHRSGFSKKVNQQMEQYFYDQAMEKYIAPGSVRSGFVFTKLDMGTKNFNVDLIGEDHQLRTFTFFIPVPGLRVDHREVDWNALYTKDEIISYDEPGLRKALERLPCCTTNQDGTKRGDPLNLVFIGSGKDLHHALIRGGWNETETLTSASEEQPFAFFSGQSQYAPVSPLYLYGRHQDAALRKARKSANECNELRLWLSPMALEGKPVWIGQISRVARIRSLLREYQIEPNVDEARTYIIQSFVYTQGLSKYGYVKGVGAAPISKPRENLTGAEYFTDGYRAVLWVSGDHISLTELEFVEWEIPMKR